MARVTGDLLIVWEAHLPEVESAEYAHGPGVSQKESAPGQRVESEGECTWADG